MRKVNFVSIAGLLLFISLCCINKWYDCVCARSSLTQNIYHRENTIINNFTAVYTTPVQVLDVETFRLWKKLQENGSSIGCKNCWPESEKACPVPGSLWWILDKQMPAIYPERALHTLPRGFAVKESSIPGAGQGVWTLQDVPPCSIIGPYWGELVDFRQANGRTVDYAFALPSGLHRDAANETMSNWVRYINCPHFENQQNLVSEEFDGEIYYRTLFEIPAGSELLVWYGDIYGNRLRQKYEEKHLVFKPRSNK